MKRLAAAIAALALAGCSSMQGMLVNRLACEDDRPIVVSMWGVIGIASDLRQSAATKRACP